MISKYHFAFVETVELFSINLFEFEAFPNCLNLDFINNFDFRW